MLNVGFDNYVNIDMIKAICGNPKARPIDNIVSYYKSTASSMIIDFTNGKKAQSVIFLNDKTIVISSISSETLKKRFENILRGKEESAGGIDE